MIIGPGIRKGNSRFTNNWKLIGKKKAAKTAALFFIVMKNYFINISF